MSTAMIWQTNSISSDDTEYLGELLGSQLAGSEVIELRADLGGGKTTFVRGLVRGAGITSRVSSPTFTLSRLYESSKLQIHHFDFYRLNDPGILSDQLTESINAPSSVIIVEWAGIVNNVLPDDHIVIEFKPRASSPDERDIIISYPEEKRDLVAKLETMWQDSKA